MVPAKITNNITHKNRMMTSPPSGVPVVCDRILPDGLGGVAFGEVQPVPPSVPCADRQLV
jgi:hypothetical protein